MAEEDVGEGCGSAIMEVGSASGDSSERRGVELAVADLVGEADVEGSFGGVFGRGMAIGAP